MKPEFTIEQIREFVKKDYPSISARMTKSLLLHFDSLQQNAKPIDKEKKTFSIRATDDNKIQIVDEKGSLYKSIHYVGDQEKKEKTDWMQQQLNKIQQEWDQAHT